MALKRWEDMTPEEKALNADAPKADVGDQGFAGEIPSFPAGLRPSTWKSGLKNLMENPGETVTAGIVGGAREMTRIPLVSDALRGVNQALNAKGRELPLVAQVAAEPLLPLAGALFPDEGESRLEAAARWAETMRNLGKAHPEAKEIGESVVPMVGTFAARSARRAQQAKPASVSKIDDIAERLHRQTLDDPTNQVYKYRHDPAYANKVDDARHDFEVGRANAAVAKSMKSEPGTPALPPGRTVNERRGGVQTSRDEEITDLIRRLTKGD